MVYTGKVSNRGSFIHYGSGMQKISSQPPRVVIDCLDTDNKLLSLLVSQAEAITPFFCNVVLSRTLKTTSLNALTELDLEQLEHDLHCWFTGLFSSSDSCNGQNMPVIKQSQPPLSLLLSNLEIILRFGEEVTAKSSDREKSYDAFIRALSENLTNKQTELENKVQFVSEMLILE